MAACLLALTAWGEIAELAAFLASLFPRLTHSVTLRHTGKKRIAASGGPFLFARGIIVSDSLESVCNFSFFFFSREVKKPRQILSRRSSRSVQQDKWRTKRHYFSSRRDEILFFFREGLLFSKKKIEKLFHFAPTSWGWTQLCQIQFSIMATAKRAPGKIHKICFIKVC